MDTKKNIELCVFSKRGLGHFQYWSVTDMTKIKYIRAHMLSIFAYCGTVGLIWNIFKKIEKDKFVFIAIGEELAGSMAHSMMMFIFYRHVNYHKELEKVLFALGDFCAYEKPIGIDKLNKNVETIIKWSALISSISLLFVWLYCMLIHCEDYVEDSCGLMYPSYFPINIYERNGRRIMTTIQVIIIIHVSQGGCFVACTVISPSVYLSNRIMHMVHMIQQIKQIEGRPKRKEHLKKVVQYHQNIIYLWEKYCGLINPSLLVLYICAPIVVSTILLQFFYTISLLNIVHFWNWVGITFFGAVIGEDICTSSEKLTEAIYECIPFDGDVETQKDMMLILIRLQRELYLPCGKFTKVNLMLFMSITKSVYSYLTIITQ